MEIPANTEVSLNYLAGLSAVASLYIELTARLSVVFRYCVQGECAWNSRQALLVTTHISSFQRDVQECDTQMYVLDIIDIHLPLILGLCPEQN